MIPTKCFAACRPDWKGALHVSEHPNPPFAGLAILSFFSADPDFNAMAGDMSEEFQERVDRSGVRPAKLWYWRHLFRNVCALTAREVMRTPLQIVVIALGVFLPSTPSQPYTFFTPCGVRLYLSMLISGGLFS